jgi:hypothetical protein
MDDAFKERGPSSMGSKAWAAARIRERMETRKAGVVTYAAQLAFQWDLDGDGLGLSAEQRAAFDNVLTRLRQGREAKMRAAAEEATRLTKATTETDVEVRVWRLVDAAFAEMSTSPDKLLSEFKSAESDLQNAITDYVRDARDDLEYLDLEFGIFPKVNELQWDSMAPDYILLHDPNFFGGDEEALLACFFGLDVDGFSAMTDDQGVERIVGYIEQAILDLANIGTQTSRIRNRVDAGLKRHIDNLLAKLPVGGMSEAYHEAMDRLGDNEDDDGMR